MSTLARFAPQLHFVPPTTSALNALCSTTRVGALQSYSTIHGNAITVRFKNDSNSNNSDDFPRLLPLSNSLALSACESTVLELWFSELQKPRFGMHKHDYRVPLDAVKQKIGVINTCYHSVSPFMKNDRRTPFAGSAEFSLLPHREELNLSVTLWDEYKRPLSTTLWTGPKGKFGGGPMGVMLSNQEVEKEMKKLKRMPMQNFVDCNNNHDEKNNNDVGSGKTEIAAENDINNNGKITPSSSFFNELFSPNLPRTDASTLTRTKNGGYSILLHQPQDDSSSSSQAAIMTIPSHDACISDFASIIWNEISATYGMKDKNTNYPAVARIVAKTATIGAVDMSKPFEFRSAPPLFTPQLFTKSWEHTTGLPNLRGEPCLGLRIETIQGDEVVGVGTYYFTSGNDM